MSLWVNALAARSGGGLTVLDGLGRALIERGADVDVTLIVPPDLVASLREPLASHALAGLFTGGRPSRLWWEHVRMTRYAERKHVGAMLGLSNVIPLVRRTGGHVRQALVVQNIAVLSDEVRRTNRGSRRRRLAMLRWATAESVRRADVVFAFSRYCVSVLESLAPGARIVFVPPGGAPTPLPEGADGRNTDVQSPYALILADLYSYKGIEDAVHAIAHPPLRELRLVVCGAVGESDYVERVRRLTALLSVQDRVVLCGSLPHDRALSLLRGAVCLLQTSRLESLGLPLIEALCEGIPAVVADTPVAREIGGSDVLYYEAGAADQLAAQVAQILDGAASAGAPAAHRRRFDWNATADGVLEGLRTIL